MTTRIPAEEKPSWALLGKSAGFALDGTYSKNHLPPGGAQQEMQGARHLRCFRVVDRAVHGPTEGRGVVHVAHYVPIPQALAQGEHCTQDRQERREMDDGSALTKERHVGGRRRACGRVGTSCGCSQRGLPPRRVAVSAIDGPCASGTGSTLRAGLSRPAGDRPAVLGGSAALPRSRCPPGHVCARGRSDRCRPPVCGSSLGIRLRSRSRPTCRR